MKKSFLFSFLATCYLLLATSTLAYVSPGNPTGFVNDFAGVFSVEEKASLETKLTNFETQIGQEISVVTIQSLDGDTIENFSEKLFQEWGIGKEEQDNGALLLIALDDREMRIEVGYGLEGSLTDLLSSRIIRETLTPAFQAGEFYAGINTATDQMIGIVGGSVPDSLEDAHQGNGFNPDFLVFGFFGLIWLGSILSRSKSWWGGGVVGGIVGTIISFIFGFLFIGLLALILFIPLGLLLDFLVSRTYSKSKDGGRIPPWWIGGGGFGSGGHGGGGFGGFSGGSSGGGGSSGSW